MKKGIVHFIGAGPGAKDLITVRGKALLEEADLILYAGSLVNPALLEYAGAGCEIRSSAAMHLAEIVDTMAEAVRQGKSVARLHTGDPSLYGAIREQMDALEERGIPYDGCPGVSACFGAAATLGLEYTLPGVSQSLIITRMEGRTPVPAAESIQSFAAHHATMAIYLSAGRIEELTGRLMEGGYGADTPAALVYKATWEEEKHVDCRLSELTEKAQASGIDHLALVLVGDAIGQADYERSRLYDPEFATGYRGADPSAYHL